MTADSDDSIPEQVDDGELQDPLDREDDDDDPSLMDRLRGSGVGVEDPDIVGDPHPGVVDAEVGEDQPPQV
jgi:hypothetical protein